jgi:hypothetical protein
MWILVSDQKGILLGYYTYIANISSDGETRLIMQESAMSNSSEEVLPMEQEQKEHKKEITIIVNSRPRTWSEKEISYKEVVILAFGSYSESENIIYTVTYSKGEDSKREGSLLKGQSVKVKEGMIFNVTQTNQS